VTSLTAALTFRKSATSYSRCAFPVVSLPSHKRWSRNNHTGVIVPSPLAIVTSSKCLARFQRFRLPNKGQTLLETTVNSNDTALGSALFLKSSAYWRPGCSRDSYLLPVAQMTGQVSHGAGVKCTVIEWRHLPTLIRSQGFRWRIIGICHWRNERVSTQPL
jgi:hypothetical protein